MTIDDLIPDKELNLGGRSRKTETDKDEKHSYGRTVEGMPFKADSDAEEWWKNAMQKCLGYRKFPYNDNEQIRAITELSNFTFLFPIEVRAQLDKHDIFETDWKEYIAHRPHLFGDYRLPEEWRERTAGQHYSMSDSIEVENEERKPYYEEIEHPDRFRKDGTKSRKGSKRSTPKDGVFSDLIDDA